MSDYNVVIIGAGAVGLALAAKLSENSLSTLVIERHSSFGNEISSRNSEVIHSGIYYEKDSLKAKLCVEGKNLLYEWCNNHKVPYSKLGKYIVAVEHNEIAGLERYLKKGIENGVEGLCLHTPEEVAKFNPGIECVAALYSPSSGIVDSHKLMESFIEHAKNYSADFAFNHSAFKTEIVNNELQTFVISNDGDNFFVSSEYVINAAGLGADLFAESSGIDIDFHNYRINYVKGHYFKLRAGLSGIAKNLIYPVPPVNFTGLGVHITLDLAGGLKLGPDVNYLDSRVQDYSVPIEFQQKFFDSAKRFIKNLQFDDLSPDQSGIRPKLQKPGETPRDFIISEESQKGLPNLINLIGIESPGLTSCISIADYIYNEFFR